MMNLDKILKNDKGHGRSSGAYYYKSWCPKSEDSPKHRLPTVSGDEDGFTEWRNFMKEYLKDLSEHEKSQNSVIDSQSSDIAWDTHVQQARELHRKKARELAQAVSSSRDVRSTRMFQEYLHFIKCKKELSVPFWDKQDVLLPQQRFERSEKFALVSEPTPPSPVEKEKLTVNEVVTQPTTETSSIEKGCEERKEVSKSPDKQEAPDNEFLDKMPNELALLAIPQPWMTKPDPIPAPSQKNFNRSPRGFVGSYFTSYN